MQKIRDLSKNRWLRRGVFGSAGLVVVGLVSLLLLTLAPGRALVTSVLDGREMGALGRLQVEGVRGNVLARFTIDRLTLSDTDGEWLVVENVRGDWDSLSALLRPLVIEEVTAGQVSILRRPNAQSQAAADRSAGGLPDLDLRNAELENLVIAPGVAGPGGRYSAQAWTRFENGGVEALAIRAQGLADNTDRIALELRRDAAGLQGLVRLDADGDSPIAHLMRLEGQAVSLQGELSGEVQQGRGVFAVRAGQAELATGELLWANAQWSTDMSVDLAAWPLLGDMPGAALQEARLAASGELSGPDLGRARLSADGVDAQVERDDLEWRLSAQLDGEILSAYLPPDIVLENAGFSGRLALDAGQRLTGQRLTGELVLTGMQHRQGRLTELAGPVNVLRDAAGLTMEADLVVSGLTLAEPRLTALIGDEARIAVQARALGESYQLDRLHLTTPAVSLTATGAIEAGHPQFVTQLDLTDVGRLRSDLSGPLSVSVTSENIDEYQLRIMADQLVWPEAGLGFLDGLVATGQIVRQGDDWLFTDGELLGQALDLDVSGQIGSGDWAVVVAGAANLENLSGPVGGSGALALNLEGRSVQGQITVDAGLAASEIVVGQTRFAEPELVIQSALDGRGVVEASWGLRGDVSEQALDLLGTARVHEGAAFLDVTAGRWGGVAATGRAALQNEELTIGLVAEEAGRFAAALDFSGVISALFEGQLDARLEMPARLIPGGSLAATELVLSGPLDAMILQGELAGQLGREFALALPGELSMSASGMTGAVSLMGGWGEAAIRTEMPIRLQAEPVQAQGRVRMGAGVLDLTLSPQRIDLEASDIPADLLGYMRGLPDLTGAVAARLQLANADGHWQGDGAVTVRDLTSRHDQTAPILQIDAELAIDGFNRLDMQVEGDALVVSVRAEETNGALDGEIAARGEIAPLARLLLPPTADLTGQVDVALDMGGRVEAPIVTGRAALQDGQVLSGTYGSSFTDIEINAVFAGDRLRIDTLSMSDGADGRASGHGEFHFESEAGYRGEAQLEMTRMRLLSLPDMDMTLSGATRLSSDDAGWLLSGQSTIDQLRVSPGNGGEQAIPNPAVTEINLPDGRARSDYVGPEVRLDYRVFSEEGVRVAGTGFDSEWSIDLAVSGRLSQPSVAGTATLKGGEVYLLSRPFDLNSGQVSLDGRLETARVEINARHQRADLTVEARIAGNVDAPELTLSSAPHLPQDEILSRLLFGRDASELSAFEAAQIAAQLSGYSMFNMINELRDRAGVDRLRITSNADGTIAVTGGHQISEDVYLEVETAGLSSLATTRVEWSLTPDLSLLSRISDDTDASVSLRWRREFD